MQYARDIRFPARRPIGWLLVLAFGLGLSCTPLDPRPDSERLTAGPPASAGDTWVERVLLVGDAGAPLMPREPVLERLTEWASRAPRKTTVVFLGDNIYPAGMSAPGDPWLPTARARLASQLDVIKSSGASGIVVPGNHDWDNSGPDALRALVDQAAFVSDYASRYGLELQMVPEPGCPGPVSIDLEVCRLVVLDTEWWLTGAERLQDFPCRRTRDQVTSELTAALATAPQPTQLVVGHHPLRTHGRHSGYHGWRSTLFPLTYWQPWAFVPLPLVYPLIVRPLIGHSPQNTTNPLYGDMVSALGQAMVESPPVAYVSGHDHSLQVIEGDASAGWYLVSGGGSSSKITPVGHGGDSRFAAARGGFMAIDLDVAGNAYLQAVSASEGSVDYATWLKFPE